MIGIVPAVAIWWILMGIWNLLFRLILSEKQRFSHRVQMQLTYEDVLRQQAAAKSWASTVIPFSILGAIDGLAHHDERLVDISLLVAGTAMLGVMNANQDVNRIEGGGTVWVDVPPSKGHALRTLVLCYTAIWITLVGAGLLTYYHA